MAKQDKTKDVILPIDAAALIQKAPVPMPENTVDPSAVVNDGDGKQAPLLINGKPVSKDNPLMTLHADGTVRPWGDTKKPDYHVSPYYRVQGGQNIIGNNIAGLRAMYQNDPKVMQILNRNIAKQGEVPMFSAEDADIIKNLLNTVPQQAPSQQMATNTLPKQMFPNN